MFYILELNNNVVGFIYGYEEYKGFLPIHKKRTYFYIDNVVISTKHKHKHNGYGRMLMDKIINKCKEKKYTDIIINVYSFNKKAISLYENLGFKDLAKDMILEL